MWPFYASNLIFLLVIGTLVLEGGVASGADDLTISVDGLQCTSCGAKCSLVCGSRQFKSCCLNFVKKRSYPKIRAVFRRSEDDDRDLGKTSRGEGGAEEREVDGGMGQESYWNPIKPWWLNRRHRQISYDQPLSLSAPPPQFPEKSSIAIDDQPSAITVDQHFILHKIPPEERQHPNSL